MQNPLTEDQITLGAHNIDPGDWNDLNFKECWYEGFYEGVKYSEAEHKRNESK